MCCTCGYASKSSKTLNACWLASVMRRNAGRAQKFLIVVALSEQEEWSCEEECERRGWVAGGDC